MSQLSTLLEVTDDERKRILQVYNITEEELQESVEVLKDWLRKSGNFPDDAATFEHRLKVFLLNSKMSLEKTKKSLENYFTMKVLYEDFLMRAVPDEKFRRIENLSKNVVMPKLLPNLCRLTIAKIHDPQGEADDGLDYYLMPIMVAELRIQYDFFLSNELLIDMEEFQMKNLIKFTPSINTKLVNLLTSLNVRINKVHIVNAPPIWDKILFLAKTFIPTKIFEKFHIHPSMEELQKYVPKEYLPSDYGGTEKSLDEIHEMWCTALEANESYLKEVRNHKVKAILRQQLDLPKDVGMGIDGSFKRLSVD